MAVTSAAIRREVVRSYRKRKPLAELLGGRLVGVIYGQNLGMSLQEMSDVDWCGRWRATPALQARVPTPS